MLEGNIDVLVVDSFDSDALLTMGALRGIHGLHAFRLSDGQQAVDFVCHSGLYADSDFATPQLMLVDCQLRALDGMSVIQRVRELYPAEDLPIVAFTTSANELVGEQCLELGASEHAAKPSVRDAYTLRVKDLATKWVRHRGRARMKIVSGWQ